MKHKQNKSIFLYTSIGNLDNSVDLEDEGPHTFDKAEDALNAAKGYTEEYGLRTYVYMCVPVFRVDREKMQVTKL